MTSCVSPPLLRPLPRSWTCSYTLPSGPESCQVGPGSPKSLAGRLQLAVPDDPTAVKELFE